MPVSKMEASAVLQQDLYTEVEFHGIARLDIANNHLVGVRVRQIDQQPQEATLFPKNMSISLELQLLDKVEGQ